MGRSLSFPSCFWQLESAQREVLFRLKQRYWSGNDHFFKHWKNPVSAITDCDGYLVLAQVCSVVVIDSFVCVFSCGGVSQHSNTGHEPLHDRPQQSFRV